jgi:hypothetical protein
MEMDLKAAMKKIIDNTTICYRQWHLNSGLSRAGRIALCDFGLARKYEAP